MSASLSIQDLIFAALRSGSLDTVSAARLADKLRVKPGQRSWATRVALAVRDDLIREYAHRHYRGLSRNRQAENIERDLHRYETSAWHSARAEVECPHRDDRRRLLWRILKLRSVPPKKRTITDILSHGA